MANVFISYAKEDRTLADSLAHDLQTEGFSVWWDRELEPGNDISGIISHELDQANAVLVIWTRNSVRKGWVIAEAKRAKEGRRDRYVAVRKSDLDPNGLPLPFNNYVVVGIGNREVWLATIRQLVALDTGHAPQPRGFPRKWGGSVGLKDILARNDGECLYFEEATESWAKSSDAGSTQQSWRKGAVLWALPIGQQTGVRLSYWREHSGLNRYLFHKPWSEWRVGPNGTHFHVQYITLVGGVLRFRFVEHILNPKELFVDAVPAPPKRVIKRLLGKTWSDIIIPGNDGQEHIIMDCVSHRIADAVVGLITEYRSKFREI